MAVGYAARGVLIYMGGFVPTAVFSPLPRSLTRLSGRNMGSLNLAKVEFFRGLVNAVEGSLFVIYAVHKKVFLL
jgi:hypothetical protein